MIKKEISYVDFNGETRKEDFYFHMSLPEFARLEAKNKGIPIDQFTKNLAKDQDLEKLIQFIEDIVLGSYGKKSEDGKRFLKTEAIREEFEFSQAYAELFEELLTSPELAEKFAAGVATQTKTKTTKPALSEVVTPE